MIDRFVRSLVSIVVASALMLTPALADHVPELKPGQPSRLDEDVERLKNEVLEINRDLSLLEQELLFPSNSRFAVFVTVQERASILLQSAQLQLDGQLADSHLYADHEKQALRKGGAQRLHLGNLSTGKHSITATLAGRYGGRREFRRVAKMEVNKGLKPVHIELRLTQAEDSAEPVLVVNQW